VIDANNYFPQRDGHIPQLDTPLDHLVGAAGLPAARRHRGEGLHTVCFQRLLDDSHPDLPAAQRLAIPVAGDDEDARRTVIELIDQIGFTGVDAGTLADGRRLQPSRRCSTTARQDGAVGERRRSSGLGATMTTSDLVATLGALGTRWRGHRRESSAMTKRRQIQAAATPFSGRTAWASLSAAVQNARKRAAVSL